MPGIGGTNGCAPRCDDDRSRRQGAGLRAGAHLHGPGRCDLRFALDHLHPEPGVALRRIVRFNGADDLVHTFHDLGEVELGLCRTNAIVGCVPDVRKQLGRADQRLRRHAAGVQTLATHLVLLDERHLRLDRRCDVGGHEPRRARTDHHQVAVEACRLRPLRVDLARLDPVHDLLGDQREDAEQRKGDQQGRGQDALEGFDLRKLGARVHVHDGAQEHADLADPIEGAGLDRRQPHHEVDHEERKCRNEPQREQVERALTLHPGVDRAQPVAELSLHGFPEQEPGSQERKGRADAGSK